MVTDRDTLLMTSSSKSAVLLSNGTESVVYRDPIRYDQCDYNLLFSHLPTNFAYLSQFQLNQISLLSSVGIGGNAQLPATLASSEQQQAVQKICYALVALCFGLFYSLIGYRFFKLSAFIIGFSLGSSIIYLILAEQKQLTVVENLIISLSIGCLFAFVALLVQYIGLFLLGITASISIATCILILIDLFHTNHSAWLCILLMFTCATLVASITLKFQKSLTIFNTSAIGSGLLLFAIDFFVENNLLLDYIFELYRVNGNSFNIFERQKALLKVAVIDSPSSRSGGMSSVEPPTTTTSFTTPRTNSNNIPSSNFTSINDVNKLNSTVENPNSALALFLHLYSSAHARLCWYTWLIFGIYFVLLISSILVQYLITGKNYDHRDSWQKLIRGSRKKRSANLEKIRLKSQVNHDQGHHHHHESSVSSSHHHNRSNHHPHHHRNRSSSKNNASSSQQQQQLQRQVQNRPNSASTSAGTDRLSLSAQSVSDTQNNDTLLLVTNELNAAAATSNKVISPNKKIKRHVKSTKAAKNVDLQIVSFEVIKSPKKESQESRKAKSSNNSKSIQSTVQNNAKVSNSVSTTTSTSSSASSTCQLIPAQIGGAGRGVVEPSAPPKPSSLTSVTSTNQQQPPPVPANPPPPKPFLQEASVFAAVAATVNNTNSLSTATTSTSSSSTGSQQKQCQQQMSALQMNLAKMAKPIGWPTGTEDQGFFMAKHQHRSNSTTSKKDSSEKFRYFYQIRRNNGDVLSQDFMNNFQNKIHSTSNLNTNSSTSESAHSPPQAHPQPNEAANRPLNSSSLTSNDSKKKSRSLSSKSKS